MFNFPERKIPSILDSDFLVNKGGAGSGNFGHSGRPGEKGGSGSGDVVSAPTTRSGRNITNEDSNPFKASQNTFGQAKVYDAVKNLPKGERLVFHYPKLHSTIVISRMAVSGLYTGTFSRPGSGQAPKEFGPTGDTATESGVGHIINEARNMLTLNN